MCHTIFEFFHISTFTLLFLLRSSRGISEIVLRFFVQKITLNRAPWKIYSMVYRCYTISLILWNFTQILLKFLQSLFSEMQRGRGGEERDHYQYLDQFHVWLTDYSPKYELSFGVLRYEINGWSPQVLESIGAWGRGEGLNARKLKKLEVYIVYISSGADFEYKLMVLLNAIPPPCLTPSPQNFLKREN